MSLQKIGSYDVKNKGNIAKSPTQIKKIDPTNVEKSGIMPLRYAVTQSKPIQAEHHR